MQIEAKCRICDKPLFVTPGDGCPKEWAMRLVPMLTCNRCADLRAKRNEAMDGIKRACVMLIQLNHSKVKGVERDLIREALTLWTKRYADWFSDFNLTRRVAWDQDFVTQLMEQPNRVDAILRAYRTNARPLITAEDQAA